MQELKTGQAIDNIAWNYLKYLWKSVYNINNYNQAYLPRENPWKKHTNIEKHRQLCDSVDSIKPYFVLKYERTLILNIIYKTGFNKKAPEYVSVPFFQGLNRTWLSWIGM